MGDAGSAVDDVDVAANKTIECGKEAAKEFMIADGYRNLNHGSFGTYPISIRNELRKYQDASEACTDWFIRYDYPRLLDVSRQAIADYLHAPVSTCVFVPNATTGTNTVMRNLVYKPNDVIIYFDTIYGACEKTVEYITETTPATSHKITGIKYPTAVSTDDYICSLFEQAIKRIKSQSKTPKLAIFDTITSMPGVRMPFERLTALCKHYNILSLIDGAHGIGHIPLNLTTLDPDFFVSNCHKWLHVPRGCAVFYVPIKNQHLMRSSLPTSHGFVPKPKEVGEDGAIRNPLPMSGKSEFVTQFEFTGTLDTSPYLCVPAALAWRSRLTWQGKRGEEAVMGYAQHLALEGGKVVAKMLGTEMMAEAERGTNFVNVRLPLEGTEMEMAVWVSDVVRKEYESFFALLVHGEAVWVRLSAQVYLTLEDFEWAGRVLEEVCERARKGEWKGKS